MSSFNPSEILDLLKCWIQFNPLPKMNAFELIWIFTELSSKTI